MMVENVWRWRYLCVVRPFWRDHSPDNIWVPISSFVLPLLPLISLSTRLIFSIFEFGFTAYNSSSFLYTICLFHPHTFFACSPTRKCIFHIHPSIRRFWSLLSYPQGVTSPHISGGRVQFFFLNSILRRVNIICSVQRHSFLRVLFFQNLWKYSNFSLRNKVVGPEIFFGGA